MSRHESNSLYTQLRQDLLRASTHHRRSATHPGFATDIHRSHLRTTQRQLGALRQAYRRTQEALLWEQYERDWRLQTPSTKAF